MLAKVGQDWVEVCGVGPTGVHRNAITLQGMNPALGGGVIVVEPDIEPTPRPDGFPENEHWPPL